MIEAPEQTESEVSTPAFAMSPRVAAGFEAGAWMTAVSHGWVTLSIAGYILLIGVWWPPMWFVMWFPIGAILVFTGVVTLLGALFGALLARLGLTRLAVIVFPGVGAGICWATYQLPVVEEVLEGQSFIACGAGLGLLAGAGFAGLMAACDD